MAAKAPLSEDELIARLRVRYTEKAGNGDAWAFIPKVRSAAAFDARRTIDAYAMALWPSRGLILNAFEIKSSRSDWQRELKNPAKAEEFYELADFFWLVIGDKKIVQPGELPPTWGLMVPHGTGLRVEVDAPALRDLSANGRRGIRPLPPGFGRSYLAALLRSACYVGRVEPAEIVEAREQGYESAKQQFESGTAMWKKMHGDLMDEVREFQQAAKIQIGGQWHGAREPREVGEAVRLVLDGDSAIDSQISRLRRVQQDAEQIASFAAQRLDALDAEPVGEPS